MKGMSHGSEVKATLYVRGEYDASLDELGSYRREIVDESLEDSK